MLARKCFHNFASTHEQEQNSQSPRLPTYFYCDAGCCSMHTHLMPPASAELVQEEDARPMTRPRRCHCNAAATFNAFHKHEATACTAESVLRGKAHGQRRQAQLRKHCVKNRLEKSMSILRCKSTLPCLRFFPCVGAELGHSE